MNLKKRTPITHFPKRFSLFFFCVLAFAQPLLAADKPSYRAEDRVVVKFKENILPADLTSLIPHLESSGIKIENIYRVFSAWETRDASTGKVTKVSTASEAFEHIRSKFPQRVGSQTATIPDLENFVAIDLKDTTVDTAKAKLEALSQVQFVEFDIAYESQSPNDDEYPQSIINPDLFNFVVPNDPEFPNQWHFLALRLTQAWDLFGHESDIGKDTVIAVLDEGCQIRNESANDPNQIYEEELLPQLWFNPGEFPGADSNGDGFLTWSEVQQHIKNDSNFSSIDITGDGVLQWREFVAPFNETFIFNGIDDDQNGYVDDFFGWNPGAASADDLFSGNNRPDRIGDGSRHAAEVMSVAAAATDNGIGVAGVSWNSQLMCIYAQNNPLIGDGFQYFTTRVANGLYYATLMGADVINMSFGHRVPEDPIGDSTVRSQLFEQMLQFVVSAGVVPVAAMGNTPLEQVSYPAGYPDVIAVGGSNWDPITRQEFPDDTTTFGSWMDVQAPSRDLVVASSDGGFGGTSGATPHVSGLAALMISYFDNSDLGTGVMRIERIRQAIRSSADSLLNPSSLLYGYGRANAHAALQEDLAGNLIARISNPVVPDDYTDAVYLVQGTATGDRFQYYRLSYFPEGDPLNKVHILPYVGSETVRGLLGIWDVSSLAPGRYVLELKVVDITGVVSQTDQVFVTR